MDGVRIRLKTGISTIGLKTKKKFFISNLEIKPFKGSKLLRSSGAYGKIITKRKNKVVVKLKSGKIKIINCYCILTLGKILNFNYYLQRYKKAGLSRLKNIRPHVRGVAMNPVDHPYGGGEGKKSKKSVLMSPWGKLQRFKKTKIR
jgi:large subunit ribosomal protein L2